MRLRLALVLTSVAASGCAEAQSSDDVAPIEIADGRLEATPTDEAAPSDEDARPPVQEALRAAAAHWRSQDPALEEDLRALDTAAGAFTEAGASQEAVLYLVSRWPRCCPKVGIAVMEGDRIVRNLTFEGSIHGLRAVPDLDGDGLDDLALTSSFGMGGSWEESVTLLSLGADGPREHGTAPVLSSGCGTGRPDAREEAARVLAAPGPVFSVERYTRACEATEWTPDGEAAPLDLDPPAEAAYVDLAGR